MVWLAGRERVVGFSFGSTRGRFDAMSILAGLADILLGGGATGVLSGGISMWAKLKEQKQQNAHEQKKWQYTVDMTRENAKHESMLADKNLLVAKQTGSDDQRLAAINAEIKLSELKNVSRWVNNIRSLHRLTLTYMLIGGAFWMHAAARKQALVGMIPSDSQMLLTIFVTNAASSAVGFWFGDRVIAAANR